MRYSNALRIALLAAFAAMQTLYAQLDTGSISGTVRDSTGAVLQAATVRIIEPETGIAVSLLSNNDGFYSAPALHIGKYTVSASAAGFATETRAGIDLRVQDRLNIDFSLSPGQTNTVVTVEGGAPLLQTEDSSMGQVVDDATMENLPLNGRNYIQLATLGAGTSPSRRGAERDTFIANGAREIQNTYLLDGIDNKNKIVGFDSSAAQAIEPVIDGVQEFKVETSTFSAEFGQAAGAVVNVTLKSGTNQFHGSVWEYLRNSFFDATPYFQVHGQKPNYNQNQFGATFGGPIIKDRTFFFASWQSLQSVEIAPQLATVPTLSQRAGIFSTPIYDPASTVANPNGSGYVRTPFPGKQVPMTLWDPVATNLLALYPLPNLPGATNFLSDQAERIASEQGNIRGDHRFNEKDTAFVRYSKQEIGSVLLDAVLTTDKTAIQEEARAAAQKLIDAYGVGVRIASINIESMTPPPDAAEAFRDVASARADAARIYNEALGYANDEIPKARGEARQMTESAAAYKKTKIDEATGDAARFDLVAGEYARASAVNGQRLYLETLEQVLPKIKKLIVDKNGNFDLTIIRKGDPPPARKNP